MVMMCVSPGDERNESKQGDYTAPHCTDRLHKEQVDINFIPLPDLASIDANSLLTIEPLFLILHCLL